MRYGLNYYFLFLYQLDENGQPVKYKEETLFSRIEEWRLELEQELGIEKFLYGK